MLNTAHRVAFNHALRIRSHLSILLVLSQLKEYVDEVLRLEGEKDALAMQLQLAQRAAQQHQQRQPIAADGAGASPRQEQLFELQLQRDQARAAAERLKRRLEELFGAGASDPSAGAPAVQAAAGGAADAGTGAAGELLGGRQGQEGGGLGGSSSGRRVAPAGGAGTGGRLGGTGGSSSGNGAKLSGREAELLSTVNNLRAALERAMAGSTPTTRFMQVCEWVWVCESRGCSVLRCCVWF